MHCLTTSRIFENCVKWGNSYTAELIYTDIANGLNKRINKIQKQVNCWEFLKGIKYDDRTEWCPLSFGEKDEKEEVVRIQLERSGTVPRFLPVLQSKCCLQQSDSERCEEASTKKLNTTMKIRLS